MKTSNIKKLKKHLIELLSKEEYKEKKILCIRQLFRQ